jgi:uncharacterized cupin superfamily protein
LPLAADGGEEILRAGDCAAFRAGNADGHHLQNRSKARARLLEIGSANLRDDEVCYPDIDRDRVGLFPERRNAVQDDLGRSD